MKSWKRAEQEVADFFGGLRRIRVQYSESVEDVIHPAFALEVKYGSQIPKSLAVKHPTTNGEFDLIPSLCWSWQLMPIEFEVVNLKRDKFVRDGIAQAIRYNKDKIPMLCVKPKQYRGFVIIMRHQDYMRGENVITPLAV